MRKRSFKQQVKYANKAILEKNKEWHKEFMNTQFSESKMQTEKKQAKRRKRKVLWLSLSSALAAIVIAVVGVLVTLPTVSEPEQQDKRYYTENVRRTDIELSEINDNLSGVKINISDVYQLKIERVYDVISEDVLYYRISAEKDETGEAVVIEFYNNPYYKMQKTLRYEPLPYLFGNKPLSYNSVVTDEDWIYIVNYEAIMETDNWSMYIEYRQYSFDEQGNFFNFLEESIEIL